MKERECINKKRKSLFVTVKGKEGGKGWEE